MSVIAKAILATFDSDTAFVWTAEMADQMVARFAVAKMQVETHFIQTAPGEWRVGFEVVSDLNTTEIIIASIRVLNGVFQSVRNFLEVQRPERDTT